MIDRTFDVEEIKSRVDVRELVPNHGALHRESSKELSGPCPKCGGTDRFHCQSSWFFCRQCHPERGDAIEFMKWLHGCGFKEACEMLGARTTPELLQRPSKADNLKQDAKWQSQRWQDEARRETEAAIFRLSTPDGEKGQRVSGFSWLSTRDIRGMEARLCAQPAKVGKGG